MLIRLYECPPKIDIDLTTTHSFINFNDMISVAIFTIMKTEEDDIFKSMDCYQLPMTSKLVNYFVLTAFINKPLMKAIGISLNDTNSY